MKTFLTQGEWEYPYEWLPAIFYHGNLFSSSRALNVKITVDYPGGFRIGMCRRGGYVVDYIELQSELHAHNMS